MLRLLSALAEQQGSFEWATASEPLRLQGQSAPEPEDVSAWPAWADTALWNAEPAQQKAWELYGETAEALKRYQNSGSADLKALDLATQELYAAQANRYYRLLSAQGKPADDAERELRGKLMNVYRRMHQTPPDELYTSLTTAKPDRGQTGPRPIDPAEQVSTAVRSTSGPGWLEFVNPAGTLARSPKVRRRPSSSRACGWSGTSSPWSSSTSSAASRRPGSAASSWMPTSTSTMSRAPAHPRCWRGGAPSPKRKDAWEYALTASAGGAVLYRSLPGGRPAVAAQMRATPDPAKQEVRVELLRTQLKGNPLRWGCRRRRLHARDAARAAQPPRASGDPKGRRRRSGAASCARGAHDALESDLVGEAARQRQGVSRIVLNEDDDVVDAPAELDDELEVAGVVDAHRLAVDRDGEVIPLDQALDLVRVRVDRLVDGGLGSRRWSS